MRPIATNGALVVWFTFLPHVRSPVLCLSIAWKPGSSICLHVWWKQRVVAHSALQHSQTAALKHCMLCGLIDIKKRVCGCIVFATRDTARRTRATGKNFASAQAQWLVLGREFSQILF